MNRHRQLLRDLSRDPRLIVVKHGGHPKIKRADGQGPIVTLAGTSTSGRGFLNAIARLRRHDMLPAGYR